MRTFVHVLVLCCVAAALTGCGCEDQTSNEARLFLDRVERIDVEGPRAERRAAVDALAAVAVENENVQRARDLCVEAHRTLLDAEETQAGAQRELDRITADGTNPNATIEPAVAARLDREITEARAGIERAHELLPRCQDEVGDLTRRYTKRR